MNGKCTCDPAWGICECGNDSAGQAATWKARMAELDQAEARKKVFLQALENARKSFENCVYEDYLNAKRENNEPVLDREIVFSREEFSYKALDVHRLWDGWAMCMGQFMRNVLRVDEIFANTEVHNKFNETVASVVKQMGFKS
jgi:hypothetical protein